jgi:hypothetical protein
MTSGNLKKLIVIYWRHPTLDWENARTTELNYELTYNSTLNIRFRSDLQYVFANCHRLTESYAANRDLVEYLRPKKIRREPLVYVELWQPVDGRREEFWSIDSDYRLKELIKQLDYYLNNWAGA